MPESSPAQSTLKRLIEAEQQAREIVKAADEQAQGTIAQAREQAQQSVEMVHQEAARVMRDQLEEIESQAATEMKQRLQRAEAEALEIERRAQLHSAPAVDLVVDWVTNQTATDRGK